MKRVLIILLFVLGVLAKEARAQAPSVPDTLAYLQAIVANKTHFIGQPFSVLKDSLKIQIKFFSPFASLNYDKSKETSTSFSFYYPQSAADHYLSYPRLEIYWQSYLNARQSDILWETNNGGGWGATVATFYATAVIADIKITK